MKRLSIALLTILAAQCPGAKQSSIEYWLKQLMGMTRHDYSHDSTNIPISAVKQIQGAGYPVEEHRIYAQDGQILTLHRIPRSYRSNYSDMTTSYGQPVLFMHGYLGSTNSWLFSPRSEALPYILADAGFDVWLGNMRTNCYSRAHLKYSTRARRFWDVTYNEIGVYDLPANVDNILAKTGFPQILYIGHSMGSTSLLVMTSTRPEYNAKIKAAFLLAPVIFPAPKQRFSPVLKSFYPYFETTYRLLLSRRKYEVFPRNDDFINLMNTTCQPGLLQSFCLQAFAQRYDMPDKNVNLKEFGNIMAGMVSGTSLTISHHLIQLIDSGMGQYDYGAKHNLRVYGSIDAPKYPLSRVTAPLYIYYGLNDILMDLQRVPYLDRTLHSVAYIGPVEDPHFTHLDFLLGNDTKNVLYNKILSQMKSL